ncbi:MAG: MFS transporter [Candidatus Bathyarchaeia archaeon]
MSNLDESGVVRSRKYLAYLFTFLVIANIFDIYATIAQSGGLFPYIRADLGLDLTQMTTYMAIAGLGGLLAFVPKSLADFIGRRLTVLLSVMGYCLFTGLMSFATAETVFIFVICVFISKIFWTSDAWAILLSEEAPARSRGRFISAVQGLGVIGGIIFSLMLGFINSIGWRTIARITFIGAVLCVIMIPGVKETWRFEKIKEERRKGKKSLKLSEMFSNLAVPFRKYGKRLLTVTILNVCVSGFIMAALLGFITEFVTNVMLWSSDKVATISLVTSLMAIFGFIASGFISDLVGRKRSVYLFAVLVLLGLLAIAFGGYLKADLLVFFGFPFTALVGYAWEILSYTLTAELFPTEIRGTASGIAFSIMCAGASVMWLFSGPIASVISLPGFFAFLVIFSIIPVPMVYSLIPETAGKELEEIAH